MLKWTGALAGAAIVGAVAGWQGDLLARPSVTTTVTSTVTETAGAVTVTQTAPSVAPAETISCAVADGSGPLTVHVKDGRIVRVRPLQIQPGELKTWKLNIGGKVLEPIQKPTVSPMALASRRRVYSPLRIRYPMKRVDFDPSSKDRKTQNRGKGEFVRITWDEALDIVAGELKRVNERYGPSAVFYDYPSHYQHGAQVHDSHYTNQPRVLCLAFGGCTTMSPNADSWEGWYYGAPLVWGHMAGPGMGLGMPDTSDTLEETLKYTKLVVYWSRDPDAQTFGFNRQDWIKALQWIKEFGIKTIYVTPDLNWGAGLHADRWIPIRPGTDTALAAAIAYVWIAENLYDKNYVETHTVGFDKWVEYITGKEDGVPKTPEWAEKICGVDARVTKALAREWASEPTMLGISMGAACRLPFGHEWPRMMIALQAMQGYGKPGVGFWDGAGGEPFNYQAGGPPCSEVRGNLAYIAKNEPPNKVKQRIWRLYRADAVLNPPIKWRGLALEGLRVQPGGAAPPSGDYVAHLVDEHTYPLPGYSEIHLWYKIGTNQLATWCQGNKLNKAYQSSKIEFIVMIDYWYGGEARFADVLLPSNTVFERNDISGWLTWFMAPATGVYNKKAIEPLWESKGDLFIDEELSKRLGVGEQFSEGNTEDDWIHKFFDITCLPKFNISYDEWKKKGYFPVPFPEKYESHPAGRAFHEDPEKNKFDTPSGSGKIDFYSTFVDKYFPGDKERPPVPHYITSWEEKYAKKYPLLVDSPHPRWRIHTQYDDVSWIRELPGHKVKGPDGYYYEALWMHPNDAEARGIKDGGIVMAYNDRAKVLFGAYVNERMMPGVVRAPDGALYDPVEPGNPESIDKGGVVNLLCSDQGLSKNANGMPPNAFRVQVEKWRG